MSDMSTTVHGASSDKVRVPPLLRCNPSHTFCLSCITQALQSSPLCPIDRLTLATGDISSAPKIVASLVDELIVCCPNGCGVDVERSCLDGHLKGRCDLEPVKCICDIPTTRRERNAVAENEHLEGDIGCIHEWRLCNDCKNQYQRVNWTVCLEGKLI
jgi:hypothetical protein